jgi:hypothetical protein
MLSACANEAIERQTVTSAAAEMNFFIGLSPQQLNREFPSLGFGQDGTTEFTFAILSGAN